MCLPYPHESCARIAGYSELGAILFLCAVYALYSHTDRETMNDEDQRRSAYVLLHLVPVGGLSAVVIGEILFDVIPEEIVTHLPVMPLFELAQGFGYYTTLIIGPLTFLYVAFGIGGISTAVTHLLIEEYV
jgi:hypothetical protein